MLPFQLIIQLYERASLLVTTKLRFGQWRNISGNARMTTALLERPAHRCDTLEIGNESYQFKKRYCQVKLRRATISG